MKTEITKAYPVLLAGGSGTRLWPVSRELFPKQLVKFFGNHSLIQHTIKRLFPLFEPENVRIVCGKKHSDNISRDIASIELSGEGNIIDEPCARNTAPAILLAVLEILKYEKDAVIFIFPADHVIRDISRFHEKINTAISLAKKGYIVTFGITPEYPETGYGYIEASETGAGEAFSIRRFVEKPDIETAEKYVRAGNFFWNSGMFAFKASVIIREFEKFKPDMLKQMRDILSEKKGLSVEQYKELESISVDYAIMENTDLGVVLPSDFGWSDIGSWKSLYDFLPKDNDGNVITAGDVILQNTKKSFIMGHERLIAVNNLEDIVIVETPDAIFVSDIENSRDVKSVVSILKEKKRPEADVHTTVYHRWGYEKFLEHTDDFIVKRIMVYPGAEFSCQQNERKKLTVIKGSANVMTDKETYILKEAESVKIPEGSFYQLKNTGDTELHLIEITETKFFESALH